jgi:hypothetical protein
MACKGRNSRYSLCPLASKMRRRSCKSVGIVGFLAINAWMTCSNVARRDTRNVTVSYNIRFWFLGGVKMEGCGLGEVLEWRCRRAGSRL